LGVVTTSKLLNKVVAMPPCDRWENDYVFL